MKIIAGSFGLTGSAKLTTRTLQLNGAKFAEYQAHGISAVNVSSETSTKFGFIFCLIGMAVFGLIGTALLGIAGAMIGIVLAVAGSFYSSKKNMAEVSFKDGRSVTLQGSKGQINRVLQFAR